MRSRDAGRAASLVGPVIYSLALAAVGMAFVSPLPSERPAPRVRPARAAACKGLSIAKQTKAVKDFAEMLPVFRHPRCINCHGGLDPLSEQHPGKGQVEDADPSDRDAFLEVCQNCHDGLAGWRVPGSPVFFTGKDDEALCLQMKQFEKTGESFVEHILNDHGDIQFIAAGFAGDRALGPDGLAQYKLVVDKPPGTQADLTAKAQKWVDDLEGHYGDSPECGCVVPKIKLKIHHVMDHNLPNALPSRETSEVEFEVNLLPMGEDKPGGYQGEFSLVRKVQMTVPKYCEVTGNSIKERWTFYAILPPESDSMEVWRTLVTNDPEGMIKCRLTAPIGGAGMGGRRLTGTSTVKTETHFREPMLGIGEPFMMPSETGSTKELTDKDLEDMEELGERVRGDTESLTITVEEVPKGE